MFYERDPKIKNERNYKMEYRIKKEDIKSIIFDLFLGGMGDSYDGVMLLDEYEKQLEWLHHIPEEIINDTRYSTDDIEDLNNYNTFKYDMLARINGEWMDKVERRLKQAIERYDLNRNY